MGHIVTMDMVRLPLAFIDGLGGPEMVLIFVIVLVLFGGQKLPEFARGFGKSIREFKKAAAGVEEEFKRALEEDERKTSAAKLAAAPSLPAGSASSTVDTGGPDAVHSPVTDDGSGSPSHDETSYDDGSHYEDAHQGGSDVPVSSDDGPTAPAGSDVAPEQKILPPGSPTPAATPAKPAPSVPNPAPENPS